MKKFQSLISAASLILVSFINQTSVFSQTSYVHKLYGIGAKDIKGTLDGGYALSDFYSTGTIYGAFGMTKVNPAGIIEFHNYYNTYCELHFNSKFSIGEFPDSTLYFSASPEDCMTGYTSWFIARLDHSGMVMSATGDAKFGMDYDRRILFKLQTIRNTTHYSVVGYFYNEDFNYNQIAGLYYLNVYDSIGTQLWSVAIDDFNYPYTKLRGSQVFYDSNGMVSDFLVNGITGTNTFLMKTDNSGNVLWQKQYQPSGYPISGMAKVDNNYFLLESMGTGSAIHKIDINGNSIGRIEIADMNFSNINIFDNSKLILTGSNVNLNPTILELDTNMNFVHAAVISNANLIAFDINETTEAILNTYTFPQDSGLYVEKRFEGSACNYVDTVIAVLISPQVTDITTQFPTMSFNTSGTAVFTTVPLSGSLIVDCSQTSGIQNSDSVGVLFNIYPNPALEIVNIHFSNPTSEKIVVEIHDLQGKKIYGKGTLSNELEIETDGLDNGVYFVSITGQNLRRIAKLIIQK